MSIYDTHTLGLAYKLAHDDAPGASHAEKFLAAQQRIRDVEPRARRGSTTVQSALEDLLRARTENYIRPATQQIEKAALRAGQQMTMAEARSQAVRQVAAERPWLFTTEPPPVVPGGRGPRGARSLELAAQAARSFAAVPVTRTAKRMSTLDMLAALDAARSKGRTRQAREKALEKVITRIHEQAGCPLGVRTHTLGGEQALAKPQPTARFVASFLAALPASRWRSPAESILRATMVRPGEGDPMALERRDLGAISTIMRMMKRSGALKRAERRSKGAR